MVKKKLHSFQYTFGVPVKANQSNFKLEQNSRIHDQYLIGVQVERASGNKKSVNNNTIVNDDTFDASYLTLKQRNTEVAENIPLTLIEKWTANGRWYPIDVPGVDMAQSQVLCSDATVLVAGEEYQLTFKYIQRITQAKK